jgi:DNA-binding NtrC family response regulator
VLIEGSGTGKELMARFIHQQFTPRSAVVTLTAGPYQGAGRQFFGYEKGAFTGATEKMKQGKFELADGGTILLDEIRELSLDMR